MKNRYLTKTTILIFLLIAAIGAGSAWLWWHGRQNSLPEGLVSGNGRIESDQISIMAKSAGRVQEMLVQEGDLVSPGQVLARIDVAELQAERGKYVADTASKKASMSEAEATVAQRKAEFALKEANLARSLTVVKAGGISEQSRDEAQSERDSTKAVLDAAVRNLAAVERSVASAQALVNQIDVQISDATLSSPVKGRVLYRLANPGEVVSAGGKVLTIVSFAEIYMEIYLPAGQAVHVPIGSQARIQLDGLDFALPAKVSFVSPDAQFTPKQIETRSERDKLVFRIKLRVSPNLINRHLDMVKTGTRGVGYVRLYPNPPAWPGFLQKRPEGDPLDAED